MSLKKQLLASSTWTLTGNAGQQLLSFLIFIYLARLLSPEDFGLVALAAAFTDIAEILVRWGLGTFLIQRKAVDSRIMSTAFWIIAALSSAAAAFMVLASEPAANFFKAPNLTWVLAYLAPLPALSALGTINDALLRRSLKFRSIAVRNIVAMVGSGGVALYLAIAGYGVVALIAQRLMFAALSTALLVISYPWAPRLTFDLATARELMVHGGHIMWNGLSLRLTPRTLDFLVGYFLGARELGLLRVSLRFFDFLAQGILLPIADVLPAVLRKIAGDMEATRRIYKRLVIFSSAIFFPMTIGIGLMAGEITHLIFGTKWSESTPLIEVLSFLAFTLPLSTFFAPVMLTRGQSKPLAQIALLRIFIVVAMTAVTAQFSLLHVALGYVAGLYAVTWASTGILSTNLGTNRGEIFMSQLPALVATLGMGLAVLTIKMTAVYQSVTDVKLQLAIGVSTGAFFYAAILLLGVYARIWPSFAQEIWATLPAFMTKRNTDRKELR